MGGGVLLMQHATKFSPLSFTACMRRPTSRVAATVARHSARCSACPCALRVTATSRHIAQLIGAVRGTVGARLHAPAMGHHPASASRPTPYRVMPDTPTTATACILTMVLLGCWLQALVQLLPITLLVSNTSTHMKL